MEVIIISSYPLYFWNFQPSVGLIRPQPCSNNFSCQEILLFSVSLSMLWLVVPLNACVNSILNQLEVRLHSGRMVHFCLSLSPRPSFQFSEGLVPRLSLPSQLVSESSSYKSTGGCLPFLKAV